MKKTAGWIDSIALGILTTLASFLFFLWTTEQYLWAAFMSLPPGFLAAILFRKNAFKRSERRERAKRAKACVEKMALMSESEAKALAARYAGFTGMLLLRHPKGASLEIDEILPIWRTCKEDLCEIATTGPIRDETYAILRSLPKPAIKLYDAKALATRFEASELPLDPVPVEKKRFSLIVPKKRAKHCAIYGVAMLGMYVVTGLWAYLAGSVILLVLLFLALRRPEPAADEPA